MNHLYIQTAFLGDLLLSTPSLRQIRRWSPQAALTLVCRKGYGSFIKSLGLVDEVVEVDKKSKRKLSQNQFAGRSFDKVFCPHQSVSSQRLASQISADEKIGYKSLLNGRVFDKRISRNLTWPEAMRQLQLVAAVDESLMVRLESFEKKPESLPPWAEMQLSQLAWSEREVQDLVNDRISGLKVSQPYVCIAPGSVWPTKRWPVESFEKLATLFVRNNYQIFILGAPDERELCERVQSNVPNSFSFAGHLSVLESLQLLSKAKGLVCNDSGAMHMASLLHLPTVALFGPTVQELGYKPWNPKAQVIEKKSLLCRPCGQHGGRSCPIGTHQCMQDVHPETVFQEASILFG